MKTILNFVVVLNFVFGSPALLRAQSVDKNPKLALPSTNAPAARGFSEKEIQMLSSCSTLPALLREKERPVNQSEMLKFLRPIAEFEAFGLLMQPRDVEAIVATNALYAKKTVSNGEPTYWLVTPKGENIFVMFTADGDCRGIQRMSPIPTDVLKQQIGENEYKTWVDKLKRLKLGAIAP